MARANYAEAFRLADFAADSNLRAWVRGLQSVGEYYAGNYRDALDLAEDGLAWAGPGPQGARLASNGVARAAGKLGDERRVHSAVDAAFELSPSNDAPGGMPSSVTFGPYSTAQVASNAATAYLSLGQPDDVQRYAHLALPEVAKSGSPWSRSLVLIDLATSAASSRGADLDQASALLMEALDISAGRPIISVTLRAREFVRTAAACWGNTRQLGGVRDALAAAEPDHG